MNKAQLKELVCQAIDARYNDVEKVAMDIFSEPELGFKEQKTSAKVKAIFDQLGMNYSDGWGITGVKARVKGKRNHLPRPSKLRSDDRGSALLWSQCTKR